MTNLLAKQHQLLAASVTLQGLQASDSVGVSRSGTPWENGWKYCVRLCLVQVQRHSLAEEQAQESHRNVKAIVCAQ